MRLALAAFLLATVALVQPGWVLYYKCEATDACVMDEDQTTKNFASKSEAISWVESNYIYSPLGLKHGKDTYICDVKYLNLEDEDPITVYRKEVTCKLHREEPTF